jgi:hypothetical protein
MKFAVRDMKVSSTMDFLFIVLRFFMPFFFGLCIMPLIAQQSDYLIKSFRVDQGLAHPNVRSIVKDTSGFLWIGTFDGMSRFDGNEFVNYRHSPADSGSIPPNEVKKLCVDHKNRLWLLNRVVSRLDRASEKFIIYHMTYDHPDSQDYPKWINKDSGGMMWVMMTKELLFYDDKKDEFIPVRVINCGVLETPVKSGHIFNFDEKGYLWIIGDEEVFCCQVNRKFDMTPITITIIANYKIFKQPSVSFYAVQQEQALTQSENGTFLFSNVGLFQLHQDKKVFIPVTAEPEANWFTGCRSFAWFDPKKGIHAWNAKRKDITLIHQSDFLQMETCFADTDETWWFSGLDLERYGIGIRHAIPLTKSFHHYFQEFKGQKTAIYAIYREKNGSFWIGNRSQDYIFHLTKNGATDRILPFNTLGCNTKSNVNISMNQVRAIAGDVLGNIWIGFLHTNQLYYLRDNGREFKKFLPDPRKIEIPGKIINNKLILPLNNGKLLAVSDVCMILINSADFKILRQKPFPVYYMGTYSVFQDNLGYLWTGHSGSIIRKYDQDLNLLDSIRLSNDFYNLECIEGNADTLWIAAMGGGLIRYITGDRSMKFYSTRNGLSNNYAYHILTDKHKNLWISTNEGLSVFNPKTEIFHTFKESDGLKIREFNADAGFLSQDGMMFFGGMGGFVGFYPDSVFAVKKREATGPLLITGVSVSGNRKSLSEPVYQLDTFRLDKSENNICLTFSKLDFRYPEEVIYRYKLDGIDPAWTMTRADNRNANYAGLSYGTYRFVVETADETGNWTHQKSLLIIIPAYYYQTLWFKISMTIIAFSVIALFLWLKYNQIRLINLKRQESLRMKSLQAQLNPHFIFNSLNSISYLISHKAQDVADQYVADFASLMRSFLDNSSRDFILLRDEIESIEHYLALEHLRLHEKFDFRIEYSPDLVTENIEVVPSLVQPFIENAVWHGIGLLRGRKGTILVRFDQTSPKFITCTVEDDGIGRVKAGLLKSEDYKKRQSKGVNLILDRLEIINSLYKTDYQVVIEDLKPGKEETGTKVSIPLPIRLT